MKDKTRTKAQLMTELQELRQRIAELERSEPVRELINTTVDAVISIDAEMKITLWNAAAEKIFGYTTEEMLGQSLMKIVPESFHNAKEKGFTKFQKTGSGPVIDKTLELEGKRKDGTLIPIELSVSSRKVGHEHIATAIARDITRRKIEKDKLNQRTHELSERVKELNCFYELEKISRIEKITIEKLLKSAVRLLPPSWQYPDITGGCIAFDGKKYKTKNFKRTKWMQSADIVVDNKKAGSIEVCYLEEKPNLDEGPFSKEERNLIDAVASRIGQIIEHKQKDEVLKDSKERLRILFEYAPDAYYLNDLKGNFIDGNKAAEKLTGYKRKELIGKNFLKLKLLPPDQMPKAAAFLAENLMGKATGPDEFVLTRKDGTRVYAEISTNPVKVKGKAVVLGIARDISKIKQAENKLKLERAYIDQLFESAQEAIVMLGKNGHIMRVNDEFIRLFGFSSYDEIVGKSVDDLVVPDDAREIAKSITNKVRMGNSVSLETVRQKKDGSLIDVSVLASPIEVDGKLLGTFGIYRDISERKRAEEALEESEARYRALFETSADGILIADIETRQFKYSNPAVCKLLGYSEKEFKELRVSDIHPKKDLKHVISEFEAQAKREKTLAQDLPCLRKDGTIVYTDISSSVCMIDEKKCSIGFFRDITERKRAEEALAREQYLMQALMDNIPDYIYFKDRESQFVRISKAHSQSFGLSDPVQALGKTDFDFFTEEHARKAYEDEQKIIQTGQPVMNIEEKETRHGRPDAWVLTTKMPLRDREERIVGTFGISRDITERKQAEERLEQSLKEKEVLLREIHHRVKNNLQIISSLLLLQSNQISGKKNLELFQESQNRVKSMALIHEKLYLSQDLASINFKEYLNTLIIGLFRSYQSHSSHVDLKLSIDDISLGIDSAIPCGLIVNELVSNSLKYAFPNGREGVISVALRSLNKKDVELVVSDNGIGMPEDLDFRNTKSLGLHLVTILAEDQLEGEIKLLRDKGTKFRIKLRGVK